MLRYTTDWTDRAGLVTFYNSRPDNGVNLFLHPGTCMGRVIHEGRLQKYSTNRPLPLVHIGTYLPPILSISANVTKYTVNSDSWTVITRCPWVTSIGTGRLPAGVIYLLPIPWTAQSTCYKLLFIQLVTLSVFLSLCTVHCYMLRTSTLATTTPLVCFCPHRAAIPSAHHLGADVLYGLLHTLLTTSHKQIRGDPQQLKILAIRH